MTALGQEAVPSYLRSADDDQIFDFQVGQVYSMLGCIDVCLDPLRIKICKSLLKGISDFKIEISKSSVGIKSIADIEPADDLTLLDQDTEPNTVIPKPKGKRQRRKQSSCILQF